MPAYDFVCECGHTQEEQVPIERRNTAYVACERCNRKMKRVEVYLLSQPISSFVPLWMKDENVQGNIEQREWLKTKEAKDMDLVKRGATVV